MTVATQAPNSIPIKDKLASFFGQPGIVRRTPIQPIAAPIRVAGIVTGAKNTA